VCLGATAAVLGARPLSAWAGVLPALGGALAGVGVPLPGLLFALWGAPLTLAALGAWAIGARACCASARWQKVPAACLAGAALVLGPPLLLAAGALFSTATIVGDVCASAPNVGANYVLARGDALCADAGGVGPAGACAFPLTLPLVGNLTLNATTVLSLPATAVAILGARCAPRGAAGDALGAALGAIAAAARAQPRAVALALINGTALMGGFMLRAPAAALATAAGSALGDAVGAFVDALAAGPLSCGALAGVLAEAKDSVCCALGAPLTTFATAWLATVAALVLVGVPLAVRARKVLPARVWGRAAVTMAEELDGGELSRGSREPSWDDDYEPRADEPLLVELTPRSSPTALRPYARPPPREHDSDAD